MIDVYGRKFPPGLNRMQRQIIESGVVSVKTTHLTGWFIPCLLATRKGNNRLAHIGNKLARSVLLGAVSVYQVGISPLLGKNCRFVPTCSEYVREAVETFGPSRGAILGAWRILRCNPFGGHGYDPPCWPPVHFRAGS